MMMQEMNEVEKIGIIKGAVLKTKQVLQIIIAVMQNKIVGRIRHTLQKLFAFPDYDRSVAPCKYGGKKAGDFYILLFSEKVGNANGIILNKRRLIIL